MTKVKVRAKRNCKFSHNGASFRFSEGETADIDVPVERIDPNSFEILGEGEEKKKINKETKKINKEVN